MLLNQNVSVKIGAIMLFENVQSEAYFHNLFKL